MAIEGSERLHLVQFVTDSYRQLVRAGIRDTVLPNLKREHRRASWYSDIYDVRFGAASSRTGLSIDFLAVHPNKSRMRDAEPWHVAKYFTTGISLLRGTQSLPLHEGQKEILLAVSDTSIERGYSTNDVIEVLKDRAVIFG